MGRFGLLWSVGSQLLAMGDGGELVVYVVLTAVDRRIECSS